MYSKILNKKFFLAVFILLSAIVANAQNNGPYFKDALKEKRTVFYSNIVKNIMKTFALPLNDNTEEAWQSAIYNVNLTKYKAPFIDIKIEEVVKNINPRSNYFKKILLELLNAEYPDKYAAAVKGVFKNATDDVKLMAMAATYILPTSSVEERKIMLQQTLVLLAKDADNAILFQLVQQIKSFNKKIITPSIKTFF